MKIKHPTLAGVERDVENVKDWLRAGWVKVDTGPEPAPTPAPAAKPRKRAAKKAAPKA